MRATAAHFVLNALNKNRIFKPYGFKGSKSTITLGLAAGLIYNSAVFFSPTVSAQQSLWNGSAGDNNWQTSENWVSGITPNQVGSIAQFGILDPNLGNGPITVGNLTLSGIEIQNLTDTLFAKSLILSNGNLTLDNSGSDVIVDVLNLSSLIFDSSLSIIAEDRLVINNLGRFSTNVAINGQLDMNENDLVINAASSSQVNLAGTLSNIANIIFTGNSASSVLFISGDNSGSITAADSFKFNSGTLKLGNANALGNGVLDFSNSSVGFTFDISQGSYALSNQLVLGSGRLSAIGVGNTLTFDAAQSLNLTNSLILNTGAGTGIKLGSALNLSGLGGVTSTGLGVVTIAGSNNTYSGTTILEQGELKIAPIATGSTLYLGALGGVGSVNAIGTGDISFLDPETMLTIDLSADANARFAGSSVNMFRNSNININGTNTSEVIFGGSSFILGNNATIDILGGTKTTFESGSINFGSGQPSHAMTLTGDVEFGNTTLTNANQIVLDIAGNVLFNAVSSIASSGISLNLNSVTAKTLSSLDALSVAMAGNLTKSGTGDLTLGGGTLLNFSANTINFNAGTIKTDSSLVSLQTSELLLDSATFNAGSTNITTNLLTLIGGSTLNLGTGVVTLTGNLSIGDAVVNLGATDQLKLNPSTGAVITTLADSKTIFNLNQHNQNLSAVNLASGANTTFYLSNQADAVLSNASNTILNLGTINLDPSTGALLKVGAWDGNEGVSVTDKVFTTTALTPEQLLQVWFQYFEKGAKQIEIGNGSYELVPITNLVGIYTNNAPNNSWNSIDNWMGEDIFSIPNHLGSKAVFDVANMVTGSAAVTVNLPEITLGALEFNGVNVNFADVVGAKLNMDSGNPLIAATIDVLSANKINIYDLGLSGDPLIVNVAAGGELSTISYQPLGSFVNVTKKGAGQYNYNGTGGLVGSFVLEKGLLSFGGANPTADSTINITGDNANLALKGAYAGGLIVEPSVNRINISNGILNNSNGLELSQTQFAFFGQSTGGGSDLILGQDFSLYGAGGLKTGKITFSSPNSIYSGDTVIDYATSGTNNTEVKQTGLFTIGGVADGTNYLGLGGIHITGGDTLISNSVDALNKVKDPGHGVTLVSNLLKVNGTFLINAGSALRLEGGELSSEGGRGTLALTGDLVFAGSTINSIAPNLALNPNAAVGLITSTTQGASYVGFGNLVKNGSNTTKIDSSLTKLGVGNITLNSGTLQLNNDEQLSVSNLSLNSGSFDVNGYIQALGTLSLTKSSIISLGNTGGLTFNNKGSWDVNSVLTIQNGGQVWDVIDSTYLRFSANPNFTTDQLQRMAFTGYGLGAEISTTLYDGYYTILPSAPLTNEWTNSAGTRLWSTAGNWLMNVVPNSVGASATIRDLDTNLAGNTITVDDTFVLGNLNFSNSDPFEYFISSQDIDSRFIFNAGTDNGEPNKSQIIHFGFGSINLNVPLELISQLEIATNTDRLIANLDLSGSISGEGGITKLGTGTLTISNENSYSGGFNWVTPSDVRINANGDVFGTGLLTIGAITADPQNYALQIGGSVDRTIDNDIALNGNLIGRYLTVPDGLGGANDLPETRTLTFNGNINLSAGGHLIKPAWTGTGTVNSASGILTTANRQSYVFDGIISGNGYLQINENTGNITISNPNNTFIGGIALETGVQTTLRLGELGSLGSGPLSLKSGTLAVPTNYTLDNPYVITNQLKLRANQLDSNYLYRTNISGNVLFDNAGTTTLTGTTGFRQSSNNIVQFGPNLLLDGSGSFNIAGSAAFLGANTFTGGYFFEQVRNTGAGATLWIGADSVVDENGLLLASAPGIGRISMKTNDARLGAFSKTGSGLTTFTLSNEILLGNALGFSRYGDANKLILDSATLVLRDGVAGVNIKGANAGAILQIDSQLIDDAAFAGGSGFTKTGLDTTLILTNGNNNFTAGFDLNGGVLQVDAQGDVTVGRIDSGNNYLGISGTNTLTSGVLNINTIDDAIVTLAGNSLLMKGSSTLNVVGGVGIKTYLEGNSSFGDASSTGSITTAGEILKTGINSVSSVWVALNTPSLVIESGVLSLQKANLLNNVQSLIFDGGTLLTNGLSQNLSAATLNLTHNSDVDFGAGASILTLGTINQVTGYLGSNDLTLTLKNWTGNQSNGNGADQVLIASLPIGTILNNVNFDGFAPGSRVITNQNGKNELIPLGIAFIWQGDTNAIWDSGGNWDKPGSPGLPGSSAIFDNTDTNLLNPGAQIDIIQSLEVGSIQFKGTENQEFTLSGNGELTLVNLVANAPAQILMSGNSKPTITNTMRLESDTLITTDSDNILTLTGGISGMPGQSALTKTGEGTLILSNANSSYDSLTVAEGTVLFGASSLAGIGVRGPAGSGTLALEDGAIIGATNGPQSLTNSVEFKGGVISVTGIDELSLIGGGLNAELLVSADSTLLVEAGSSLVIGSDLLLKGDANLTKEGTGLLTLNGADNTTFTGELILNEGTVELAASGALGAATGVTVNADGILLANTVNNVFGINTPITIDTDGILITGTTDQQLTELSGAGTITTTGGTLTLTNALGSDTTFSGDLEGSAGVVVNGAGNLTLVNATYTGDTLVSAGGLILNTAGASDITVSTGAKTILDFTLAGLMGNTLSGLGTVEIGSDADAPLITLTADNSGFNGIWDLTGNVSISNINNLGAGSLVGEGTLNLDLATDSTEFTFDSNIGTDFAGTTALNTGVLDLTATNNQSVLTNSTLEIGANGTAKAGDGSTEISMGGLSFNGGLLAFDIYAPDPALPPSVIEGAVVTVDTLDLSGMGSISINLPDSTSTPTPTPITNGSLLGQDGAGEIQIQLVGLAAGGTVIGDGANISVVDQNGNDISQLEGLTTDIMQGAIGSQSKVAEGTYGYEVGALNSATLATDGLYVSYVLTQVDIVAGESLILQPADWESIEGNELSAKITDSGSGVLAGNVIIDAAAGSNDLIILSNTKNDYHGSTQVISGTLEIGADHALGNTSNLIVNNGTTARLGADIEQTVGQLNTAAMSSLVLNGTLTIDDSQRDAGITSGGTISTGSLSGEGKLVVDTSELNLLGANALYLGDTDIINGSVVTLNDVASLGINSTLLIDDIDNSKLIYDGVIGNVANVIMGAGTVLFANDSTVTLTNTSNTLSGAWDIEAGSTLIASQTGHLGAAEVAISGELNLAPASGTLVLSNSLSGAGLLHKTGAGSLSLTNDNVSADGSMFTGSTDIDAGQLILSNENALGGVVTIDTLATDASQGLVFDFDTAGNTTVQLAGSGQASIIGEKTTLSADSSGYIGTLNVAAGSIGAFNDAMALGVGHYLGNSSTLNLAGTVSGDASSYGTFSATSTGNLDWTNALVGGGLLQIDTTINTNNFSFGSNTGDKFSGTVALSNTQFSLSSVSDSDNFNALANATLRADAGSQISVGSAANSDTIGGFKFNGGTVAFEVTEAPVILPDNTTLLGSTSGTLQVTGNLDLSGTGNVMIDLGGLGNLLDVPPEFAGQSINSSVLMPFQTDNTLLVLAKSDGTTTGNGGALSLIDEDGNVISDEQSLDVVLKSGLKSANAIVDYRLSSIASGQTGSNATGLYVNYGLVELQLLTSGDDATVLYAPIDAQGVLADMSAKITGVGDLIIEADDAKDNISISNQLNSYTGQTWVKSGSLVLGNSDVLGETSNLLVSNAATVTVDSLITQTVGALNLEEGSQLVLNGELTIDVTQGGQDNNLLMGETLIGAGILNLVGSDLTINGSNAEFAGTLSIDEDSTATLDEVAGIGTQGIIDVAGKLTFSEVDGDMSKTLIGTGVIELIDASTLTLKATDNTFTGTYHIKDSSILNANSVNQFGDSVNNSASIELSKYGVFDLHGRNQFIKELTNGGVIQSTDTTPGAILTVGEYVSNGGLLILNTVLGDSDSETDLLKVEGDVIMGSGPTRVSIVNQGGLGAPTDGLGIKIIEILGTSPIDAFVLEKEVTAGAFSYGLTQNEMDGNWYLNSGGSAGTQVPNNPGALIDSVTGALASNYGVELLGTYRDRVPTSVSVSFDMAPKAWGRLFGTSGDVGDKNSIESFNRQGASYDYTTSGIQVGHDVYREQNGNGAINTAGVYFGHGQTRSDVSTPSGADAGKLSLKGYSLGAYFTHENPDNWYADAVLQGTFYRDITNQANAGGASKTQGFGMLGSLEVGKAFAIGNGTTLEPQAQLIHQSMNISDTQSVDRLVAYDKTNTQYARAGLRLTQTFNTDVTRPLNAWVNTDVWQTLGDDAQRTTISNLSGDNGLGIDTSLGNRWGRVGAGVTGQVTDNMTVDVGVKYSNSLDSEKSSSVSGKIGLQLNW